MLSSGSDSRVSLSSARNILMTAPDAVVGSKLCGITRLFSAKMLPRVQKIFFSKKMNPSLLEIFKPIYVLLTILGLFPYSVKFKTKHNCAIIQRSIYINSLRAVTLLMIMLVFGGLEIRILALEVTIKDKAMMIQINYILEVLLLLATCVTAYGSVYFFRYTIVNILNSLASAWIELPTSKNNILKTLQYQVSVTFFLLGLALIAEIAINFSRAGGLWKMFNITMSFIYPQMIQFIVLAFYCVLVQLLVALLKNLNEALETFRRKKSCYRNFETRLSMLDLSVMESVYVKAFEIKRGINETFQATILLTSVQCFHAIVSEAHIIYHGVIVARTLNTHESINFSVWIGYQLIKVYFLAYTGNILKESVGVLMSTCSRIVMSKP